MSWCFREGRVMRSQQRTEWRKIQNSNVSVFGNLFVTFSATVSVFQKCEILQFFWKPGWEYLNYVAPNSWLIFLWMTIFFLVYIPSCIKASWRDFGINTSYFIWKPLSPRRLIFPTEIPSAFLHSLSSIPTLIPYASSVSLRSCLSPRHVISCLMPNFFHGFHSVIIPFPMLPDQLLAMWRWSRRP